MPTTRPKQLPWALLRPDDRSYIESGFWKRRVWASAVVLASDGPLFETMAEKEVSAQSLTDDN